MFNAVLYTANSGCQWRMMPKDFPSASTVQRYFYDLRDRDLIETIRFHLAVAARELESREAGPTAGVIDSQSVKPRKTAVFVAMIPERRSRDASGTSSSTPPA